MPEDTALGDFFGAPPPEVERMVEAVLFASAEPLTPAQIAERLPEGVPVAEALRALQARYGARGVQLRRIGCAPTCAARWRSCAASYAARWPSCAPRFTAIWAI